MNIVLEKKTWSSLDVIIAILGSVFLLHNHSPFIALYISSTMWAFIVVASFATLIMACISVKAPITYLAPLLLLLFLNRLFVYKNIVLVISSFAQIAIYPLMTCYILARRNHGVCVFILGCFLSVLLITGFTSTLAFQIDPNFVRYNIGTLKEQESAMYYLKAKLNVGSFDMAYSYTALLPLVIFVAKWRRALFRRKFIRFISIFMIAYFVVVIYISQYTLNMLVAAMALILVLVRRKINKRFFINSIIVLSVTLVLVRGLLPPILHSISGSLDQSIMSDRIEDLAYTLEGRDNEVDSRSDFQAREDVYMTSINTIFKYPIIGSWNLSGIGGHSLILDNIAIFGLIGVILLYLFYKTMYERYYKSYRNGPFIYYYYYSLISLTIFYVVNPDGLYAVVFFCLPLCCVLMNDALLRKKIIY